MVLVAGVSCLFLEVNYYNENIFEKLFLGNP